MKAAGVFLMHLFLVAPALSKPLDDLRVNNTEMNVRTTVDACKNELSLCNEYSALKKENNEESKIKMVAGCISWLQKEEEYSSNISKVVNSGYFKNYIGGLYLDSGLDEKFKRAEELAKTAKPNFILCSKFELDVWKLDMVSWVSRNETSGSINSKVRECVAAFRSIAPDAVSKTDQAKEFEIGMRLGSLSIAVSEVKDEVNKLKAPVTKTDSKNSEVKAIPFSKCDFLNHRK